MVRYMIDIKFSDDFSYKHDSVCFLVGDDLSLPLNGLNLDRKTNGLITAAINSNDNFKGKFGQYISLTTMIENQQFLKIILLGSGKKSELTEYKIEELGGHVASALKCMRVKNTFIDTSDIDGADSAKNAALISSGILLASYNFNKYFTTKKADELPVLEIVELYTTDIEKSETQFEELKIVADAVLNARDLISEPGNVLYPESYSEIIRDALEPLDVEVEILGEKEMRKLGMNALLGVGQGSTKESKLVIMRYFGGDKDSAPVAFVGKGVTFDTGGISIKPSNNMGDMKYDMAGSAAVFGVIKALASRNAKVNAVGVVGLVENMPGGNAQRPGDVVRSMSGKTIEVLDTDAEGRLVLADALWYTQDRFKPSIMIDLATLTGAITIALGNVYGGMFCNDEKLASKLLESGKLSGEELWRMPLHSEYDKMIKSDIADVANLGAPRGHASSNTAAQFLQHFVNETAWAHLDIAGVANNSKPKTLSPKGPVGYGIKLLNSLVKEYYES